MEKKHTVDLGFLDSQREREKNTVDLGLGDFSERKKNVDQGFWDFKKVKKNHCGFGDVLREDKTL